MPTRRTYLVPLTMRAMQVLEFLARSKRGASLSSVSRNLALPKSSTYLVLKTLEQEGYLREASGPENSTLASGSFAFAGARLPTWACAKWQGLS